MNLDTIEHAMAALAKADPDIARALPLVGRPSLASVIKALRRSSPPSLASSYPPKRPARLWAA